MPTLYAVRREDGSWTGDSLSHALGRCKPGTSWEIKLTRLLPTRSNAQNRWYWGVVVPMVAESTGDDEQSIHDALLLKFAATKTYGKKDRRYTLTVPKRSKYMTTAEFSDYCEKVRDWAAQFLGVNIPDPVS